MAGILSWLSVHPDQEYGTASRDLIETRADGVSRMEGYCMWPSACRICETEDSAAEGQRLSRPSGLGECRGNPRRSALIETDGTY